MRRALPTHVTGERVRIALTEASPAGLTTPQLVAATQLSAAQVHRGVVWIRDVAATEHLTPLTWSHRDGYRFSDDPDDWVAYEVAQLHTELTRIGRLITGCLAPHARRMPNDEWVSAVLGQIEGVRSGLTMATLRRGN